jgi:septum formation protein
MNIVLSKPLLLASNSPRRRQLLKDCGFTFGVAVRPTDETYPDDMLPAGVPAYLARQKAEQFRPDAGEQLVLCADTIVVKGSQILNKPANPEEARHMLRLLSGTTHQVITGLCLLANGEFRTDTDTALVTFRSLTDREIETYVQSESPFDKAGAYGIQDWIGMVGIERIEGSFYTIMGLPTHRVYELLSPYFVH